MLYYQAYKLWNTVGLYKVLYRVFTSGTSTVQYFNLSTIQNYKLQ